MTTLLLIASVVLWLVVLLLGFLLLGTLRSLALLRWQLEDLAATTPNRLGRSGLKPGKKAPNFTLPSAEGPEVALHDLAGRKLLLVFLQAGCSPCQAIVPELNRLAGEVQVLAVCHGDADAVRAWVAEARPTFPVLVQERFGVSKQYEVFATPFAFLIDEQGVIRSKGIVNNRQHLGFVLSSAGAAEHNGQAEVAPRRAETVEMS
jgi:methylamine dehydrogenase accessory protein MauD